MDGFENLVENTLKIEPSDSGKVFGINPDMLHKQPAIRKDTGRNEDGTFKIGVSGNPSGRPKGTMKDYLRRKFMEMADEEKEAFLVKVSPEMQIRLAEGNPSEEKKLNVDATVNTTQLTQEQIDAINKIALDDQ